VEVTDAGEIFLDQPTVILVTGYPVRKAVDSGSKEPLFQFASDEFLLKMRK